MRKFSALALILVAVSLGCLRPETMTITVPHGVSGRIVVPCSGTYDGELKVDITAAGTAPVTKCATSPRNILIMQDGSALSPTNLKMNRTGDGIVTAIEFEIR